MDLGIYKFISAEKSSEYIAAAKQEFVPKNAKKNKILTFIRLFIIMIMFQKG